MNRKTSIIATVKNETDTIADLIDSMLSQTLEPDEIVINDNNSTDGTMEVIQHYCQLHKYIRVVQGDGNISQGRNRAIRHSTGQIIACCDAGTRLSDRWLEAITGDLFDSRADIVGGYSQSSPQTFWELMLGIVTLPDSAQINPSTYLPGGRSVAFTREAWELAGGFPEWLDYCEDLVFDKTLKRHGQRFVFAAEAIVYFRPRRTPYAHFVQYFNYAHGDATAKLWTRRHLLRYTAYAALLLAFLVSYLTKSATSIPIILAGIVIYLLMPYQRLLKRRKHLIWTQKVIAIISIPFIRLLGDVAKMLGYAVGLWDCSKRKLRDK